MEFEDYSLEEMNELVGSPISKKEIRQFERTDRVDNEKVAKHIVGKKVKIDLGGGATYTGRIKKVIISRLNCMVVLDDDSCYDLYDLNSIVLTDEKK